jgi:AcrR family transcriptional regulator
MVPLKKTEKRKREIVEAAASHLIEHGFQRSGLRAIAQSVGMSDRMIMYYFETKDDLVSAALEMIGEGLAAGMESAVPQGNATPSQILEALSQTMQSEEVQAIMRLWFEIIGLAMRGQEPYRKTAALLLSRSEKQIRDKLRSDQKHRAREVLDTLEGRVMVGLLLD